MKLFRSKKSQPAPPAGRQRVVREETGLKRNQAFSYYAQRSTIEAEKREQAQRRSALERSISERFKGLLVSRGSLIAGILVVLAIVLANGWLSGSAKVVIDGSNSGLLQSPDQYVAAANAALSSSPANHTKWTIDAPAVAKQVEAKYPEIRSASVVIPAVGNQPVLHIEAAQPSLVLTTTSGQAYVVDTDGKAIATTTQVSSNITDKLPRLADQSGLPITVGKAALPVQTVSFISSVLFELKHANYTPVNMTLPAGTSELDLQLTNTTYKVKFNLMGDARIQAGTLFATKQHLEGENITPSEYIDVRVEGRAYYK